MDCNFTTIKTCELKGSTFRSRILDFGDFDISDYIFSVVFWNDLGQKLNTETLEKVENKVVIPLTSIENRTGRIRTEVWMEREGGFKDIVVVFDVGISTTGCPDDSSITDGVSVTFGGMKVPVVITQAIVNNYLDYESLTPEQQAELVGPQGPEGPEGPQGPQGPQGIQGPEGERGLKGDKGDKGDTGEKGDDGYTPIKGVDYFDGAKGDKGDTGQTGAKGDKGDKGDQGIQGVAGNNGWQPLLVADTTTIPGKTLLKLQDWIGGTGTKPTDYVGQWQTAEGGYTSTAANAMDLNLIVTTSVDDRVTALELNGKEFNEAPFKTLNVGSGGMVTITPTTRYGTYRLTVLENVLINFDLSKMLAQIGSARARIIIDMPILRTITFAKPILFGGTPPTFPSAGQYVLELVDVDGGNTPLIWQVASTLKAQATGNILYVDSTGADYSTAQINAGTVTRTNSSWANPFKYLQNAINAAIAGDVIFVKAGTYYPTHLQGSATYSAGDHQNRSACFTMKTGVDVYGGFLGTETRSWQRQINANGRMINLSILNGDIMREAAIDSAKTIGDLRTDASKANAAYSVVYANVASYTYLDGFDVIYGNSTVSGGGINSINTNLVGKNNRVYNNTATINGGGWVYGINTNCSAYNNTAASGGGWRYGINTNCVSYNNTAGNGGGWRDGINTNCSAYNNTSPTGGGWSSGINTNCSAYNNSAANGGGWTSGTNTNCVAYNNTASSNGGGWTSGTNTNCSAYNNIAATCVYIHPTTGDGKNINCSLFGNKNSSNSTVGFTSTNSTNVVIFRNNAYDTPHPSIVGGAGGDINFVIQNMTLSQIKIEVPSFAGVATNSTQRTELETFAANMVSKLKPKAGSVLKGAGINNATYPNPTDFEGTQRPVNSTIGVLEGL